MIPDDFGFHHDIATVRMAHFGIFICHFLPERGGFLDQNAYLINDVIRYHNIKDAVEDSGQTFYPSDSYEDQELDDEIKSITL